MPDRRVLWVDAGRGLAITLVVLYHSAQWLEAPGFDTLAWQQVNDGLATLRMPLFFAISGMFAGKWLAVSWGRLWRDKISLFIWVFLVWSFLATGPFILGLIMQGERGNFLAQYRYVFVALWAPRFELWFIWALSLFFVVSRLIKAAPPALQLAGAGILSVAALSGWDLGNVGWDGAAKYYFFFLLGMHGRDQLFALGRDRHRGRLIAIGALWGVMAILGVVLDFNTELPGYYFVTALLGVVTGISVSRVLARFGRLRYVGGHTLPVYLTHTPLILLLAWPLQYLPEAFKSAPAAAAVAVPVVAIIAMVLGLALSRFAGKRTLTSYLFEAPPLFRGVPARARSGAVSS